MSEHDPDPPVNHCRRDGDDVQNFAAVGCLLCVLFWLTVMAFLFAFFLVSRAHGAPAPLPRLARMEHAAEPAPRPFAEVWAASDIVRRFPPLCVATSNRQFASRRLAWLVARHGLGLDPERLDDEIVRQTRRFQAWDVLESLLIEEHLSEHGNYWLKEQLQEQIGQEAYLSGRMPDPAPWWTFERAD